MNIKNERPKHLGAIWTNLGTPESQANHEIDWEGVQILDKESVEIIRKIKEAN